MDFKFVEAGRVKDSVSVKDRKLLRERLKCHDFEWYLTNVWDFNFYPRHGAFYGKVRALAFVNFFYLTIL